MGASSHIKGKIQGSLGSLKQAGGLFSFLFSLVFLEVSQLLFREEGELFLPLNGRGEEGRMQPSYALLSLFAAGSIECHRRHLLGTVVLSPWPLH